MKRTILPVVILLALSVIAVGMVIGASSAAKDQSTDMPNSLVDQSKVTFKQAQPQIVADPAVTTIQLTPSNTGNWRYPAVAEDSKGNVLAIFRGPEGNKYYYTYCPKGGTWSAPLIIAGGNQPSLVEGLYANIVVDSSDRFHCEWENANGAVYASFRDGVWTTPFKPQLTGRYDWTSAIAVRSNDQIVTIDCEVLGWTKDIYLHTKGKNDAEFSTPFNITRDGESSTQPSLAIDANDNVWAVWKSDLALPDPEIDNLVIYLAQFDVNNRDVGNWIRLSESPSWSFLPQVAINSEEKIMSMWAWSTGAQHMSRIYNPATKVLDEAVSLDIGLVTQPWHTFFSRLTAHGKDFYAAAMTAGKILLLMKFNETTAKWSKVAQISDSAVFMFSLYSGYEKMYVAWDNSGESSNIFLSTVGVDPYSKIKVKSVSNLTVVKRVERGLFRGYTLNALNWTANPDNTEKAIVITAHRIYRKTRSEDDTKWTRIGEVAGTVLKYDDRNIPANSDYVYAVTCVDDAEHESAIF